METSTLTRCAAVLLVACAPAAAATLVADYQFHGNYHSAVAGAPDLVPLNTVTFSTALINGQTTDVAAFTQGSGLRMDTPIPLSSGYTVVLLFEFDTTGGYRKMVDFQDQTADAGLYNFNGVLDFYPVASGTTITIGTGSYVQVAMTRDSAGQVVGYVNGSQQFSFSDTSGYSLLAGNSFNLFIDDTHTGTQESSAGQVARVRLWDGALTPAQIAALTGCYANCDGSTASPVLNVSDFTCFLQKFAAGNAYANCDGSTAAPVLNVSDFTCFLQKFAAGCP